jgi:hypothetical protein
MPKAHLKTLLDPLIVRLGGASEDWGPTGRCRLRLAPRYHVCYTFPIHMILPPLSPW